VNIQVDGDDVTSKHSYDARREPRHAATPRTPGYARYVGRVGGLAVALGIGAAIANSPGVASANTDDHGSPGPASVSTSPDSDSKSTFGPKGHLHPRLFNGAGKGQAAAAVRKAPRPTALRLPNDARRALSQRPNIAAAQAFSQTRKAPARPARNDAVSAMLAWARRESEHTVVTGNGSVTGARSLVAAATSGTLDDSLATGNQLAAERRAQQIVDTPVAAVAKVILDVAWFASAESNFAQVGGPDLSNLAQLNSSVDEYANQAAMEVQLLDPNNPKVLQQVMPPHTWAGQTVGGTRIWYDNPDTIYRFVPVNAASEYVITGKFDENHLPADTNFSVLTGLNGDTASNLSGDEIVTDGQGNYQITVSSDPVAPGQTNHLYLPSDATLITTRNTLGDDSEVPMTVAITRVSGPPDSLFAQIGGFLIPGIGPAVTESPALTTLVSVIPPLKNPPLALQASETALLMMILGISKEAEYMAVATTDPVTGDLRPPNTISEPSYNAQFLSTQLQSTGYFQLADDQALVLTIDPGSAEYFVVPVTNDWTITGNPSSSLNNHQAVPNGDGTYTVVISKNDPGMANWVSTGGLNQGTLSIRFQKVSGTKPRIVSQEVVQI
jgi:hypothetical protein